MHVILNSIICREIVRILIEACAVLSFHPQWRIFYYLQYPSIILVAFMQSLLVRDLDSWSMRDGDHACGNSPRPSQRLYVTRMRSTVRLADTRSYDKFAYRSEPCIIVLETSDKDERTSTSLTAGRLETFHDGRWGTVCSDGFDSVDAAVLCGALTGSSAGPSIDLSTSCNKCFPRSLPSTISTGSTSGYS